MADFESNVNALTDTPALFKLKPSVSIDESRQITIHELELLKGLRQFNEVQSGGVGVPVFDDVQTLQALGSDATRVGLFRGVASGSVYKCTAVAADGLTSSWEPALGTVSALDFGVAAGAEVTVRLQAAIDYASALRGSTNKEQGVPLYLPAGTYTINATIKLWGGHGSAGRTHLHGAGSSSTTIKLDDASDCDMMQFNGRHTPLGDEFHHHSTIRGFRLDGNVANQTTSNLKGLDCYKMGSGTLVEDVKVDDVKGDGIHLEAASNARFQNVGVARAERYGVHILGGSSDAVVLDTVEIGDCTSAGMFVDNHTGNGFTNFLFINLRLESDAVEMTDMVRFERMNGASATFVSPKFHATDAADTHYAFRIANTTAPRLTWVGLGSYQLDALVEDDINSNTIVFTNDRANGSYLTQQIHEVDDAAHATVGAAVAGTDTQARFAMTPSGPAWGPGNGALDIRTVRDNATRLTVRDIGGTIRQLSADLIADGELRAPSKADATRGAAGTAGRIIFNTDDGQLNVDDGTNWTLPDGTTT